MQREAKITKFKTKKEAEINTGLFAVWEFPDLEKKTIRLFDIFHAFCLFEYSSLYGSE